MSSRTSTHPQCLHGNIKLKLFDNVVCLFDTMLCYLTQQSIFGARRKFISSNDICNATSQMKYWNRNRLFFGAGIVHQTRLSDVLMINSCFYGQNCDKKLTIQITVIERFFHVVFCIILKKLGHTFNPKNEIL